jgi:hypothetical protein
VFKLFSETTTLFPERSLMQFVRVLGSSLARIADAAVSLFLSDVETPITDAQSGELALARAQLDAIGALNLLSDHLEILFRAHMELAVRRNTAARTEASRRSRCTWRSGSSTWSDSPSVSALARPGAPFDRR